MPLFLLSMLGGQLTDFYVLGLFLLGNEEGANIKQYVRELSESSQQDGCAVIRGATVSAAPSSVRHRLSFCLP